MADISTQPDDIGADERRSALRTVLKVAPYLWPEGEAWAKRRVVLALVMLLAAKLVAVLTPFLYKAGVDALAGDAAADAAWTLGLGAVGLTIAYGMARAMSVGFQELRDAIFTRVGARALRKLALETFQHIHALSLRFHISRKTGGLSRVIERGIKGVDFLLRFMLFSVGPLILELLLTCVILALAFDITYMLVLAVTVVIYVSFTFLVTEWRVRIRRVLNEQDTDANQKAVDSLLNYETVKYFNAEAREAERYDAAMAGFEAASIKTNHSLALLNIGQTVIISSGLVIVMVMAALGVSRGELTVGDFVLVNAYMIQITIPLNMLGWVYREIRQSLVDMGTMFELLEQPREITEPPG
ncbi:MAG: ABC transporter transmembrane domain-containing protein, partial [Pseudomonadota bacterium]